jgi:twitching motility two-component system response regulator PilH
MHSNKKVMVVDDVSTDLLNLINVVSKSNHEVVTATSGREAITKAKQELPDLIFMDIVMDDIDGYSACREIHKDPVTEGIPVVFVSSKNQKVDHLWAKKQGGKALVSKPYSEEQILQQIKMFC